MVKIAKLAARIGSAFIALGTSVLAGATLAVVVVEGRLNALNDMTWRAGWIMRGRPLAPGEADGTWLLEAEWRVALFTAISIAVLGSMLWCVLSWRGLDSLRTAALVGLGLCALAAGLWFQFDDNTIRAISFTTLIGLLGALAGCVTYAIDRFLVKCFAC